MNIEALLSATEVLLAQNYLTNALSATILQKKF